jgi:PEP-CTERM motif
MVSVKIEFDPAEADAQGGNMRSIILIAATAALFATASAPAYAGLVNPTSTVNPFFDYVGVTPPTVGPQVAASTGFSTGTPGPFSLAAPITPPMYTTEPFNIAANAGFFFTDTKVTIYNNADPPVPFCFSSSNTGSSCADPYNTFDFVFTNEDITKVAVDPSSSADFLPATFGSHTGLTLVSPNEFTVDVTGDNPAFLATLVIDVTTKGSVTPVPEPSTWALMGLGFVGLGFAGWRRRTAPAAA